MVNQSSNCSTANAAVDHAAAVTSKRASTHSLKIPFVDECWRLDRPVGNGDAGGLGLGEAGDSLPRGVKVIVYVHGFRQRYFQGVCLVQNVRKHCQRAQTLSSSSLSSQTSRALLFRSSLAHFINHSLLHILPVHSNALYVKHQLDTQGGSPIRRLSPRATRPMSPLFSIKR